MTGEEGTKELPPEVEKLGYEVVEARFQTLFGTDTLTFFIYKKGGVDLNDCEKVSSALDPILDEMDIGVDNYNFNVSSPGLDRPIVTMDDYRRNEGEEVEIVFVNPQNKKKSAHGVLVKYDEETFTLRLGEKETTYRKDAASVVRPYVHFK